MVPLRCAQKYFAGGANASRTVSDPQSRINSSGRCIHCINPDRKVTSGGASWDSTGRLRDRERGRKKRERDSRGRGRSRERERERKEKERERKSERRERERVDYKSTSL